MNAMESMQQSGELQPQTLTVVTRDNTQPGMCTTKDPEKFSNNSGFEESLAPKLSSTTSQDRECETSAPTLKESTDDEVLTQMKLKIEEFAEKRNTLLLELSQKFEDLFKQFLSGHELIWKKKHETMSALVTKIDDQTRLNTQLQHQLETLHRKIVQFYETIGQVSKCHNQEDQ